MKKVLLLCCICFAFAIKSFAQPYADTCCLAGSWGVCKWGTTATTPYPIGTSAPITVGAAIYFNMNYACDTRCGISTSTFEYQIMDVTGTTVLYTTGPGKPASYNFIVPTSIASGGSYPTTVTLNVIVKCGSWTCKNLYTKQCPVIAVNCCTTSNWGIKTFKRTLPLPNLVTPFNCNTTLAPMKQGTPTTFNMVFNCGGTPNTCVPKLKYKLYKNGGILLSTTGGASGSNVNIVMPFLMPSVSYYMVVEGYCINPTTGAGANTPCNTCTFKLQIVP